MVRVEMPHRLVFCFSQPHPHRYPGRITKAQAKDIPCKGVRMSLLALGVSGRITSLTTPQFTRPLSRGIMNGIIPRLDVTVSLMKPPLHLAHTSEYYLDNSPQLATRPYPFSSPTNPEYGEHSPTSLSTPHYNPAVQKHPRQTKPPIPRVPPPSEKAGGCVNG